MNEIADLAKQAVNVLGPLLPLAASAGSVLAAKAADGFLTEPGAKLFNWLADKFNGTHAETTLDRAVAEPASKRSLDRLRLEIEEMAENDGEFSKQLAEILEEVAREKPASVITQTATVTGSNNTTMQQAGNNNTAYKG